MLKTLATSLASTTPPLRLIAANVPLAWRQRKTRRKRRKKRLRHCPPWLVFPSVLLVVDFALDYHRRRLIHCCLSQVQYCFCYLSFDSQRRRISTQVWYIVKALACSLTSRRNQLSSTLWIWGLSFIRAQGSGAL